jgi:hypothetical protein
MTEVKCSVESCHYWGDGNVCTADSIMVKNTLPSDTDDNMYRISDMEIGTMKQDIDQENMRRTRSDTTQGKQGEHATRSSETCCETFRPKKR